MKTKTKPKVCADRGETWRCDPSPMVIDETWRAIGCEPQTMLCDMCLSSNYGWLRPGADPDDIVPLFDPPHRSVAQIGAVKVGRAQTIGRPAAAWIIFPSVSIRSGKRRHALHHLPTHAAARLRLRPGQCRARHAGAAGLARAQEHPAHGALYRTCAGSI